MSDLKSVVQNIVHEETQMSGDGKAMQLTVKRIGEPDEPGALDFGGSEYSEAEIEWLDPIKRSEDDKYGWWELASGMYYVEFNETLDLAGYTTVHLQIWENALKSGVTHPSQILSGSKAPVGTFIQVSDAGIGIKENARLSEIRILEG